MPSVRLYLSDRGPRHLLRTNLPPTRVPTAPPSSEPTDRLRQERRLIAQTVYECPSCTERFLGQRRCGDCNLWCRKVGLGGECSGCAEILTIADLLGANPEGGALA